ncbi:PAAR domain-containing protein [Kribbella sp. NPDC055110]
MPAAARIGDPTGHPGTITGPGVATVLIGGSPAAVMGDMHACSFPPPASHPPSPLTKGSGTVLISNRPAVRMGDIAGCGAPVIAGCMTVVVGG